MHAEKYIGQMSGYKLFKLENGMYWAIGNGEEKFFKDLLPFLEWLDNEVEKIVKGVH